MSVRIKDLSTFKNLQLLIFFFLPTEQSESVYSFAVHTLETVNLIIKTFVVMVQANIWHKFIFSFSKTFSNWGI